MSTDPLFLGIDLSTQQLKAVFVDGRGQVQHTVAVNFDRDVPEFGTRDGVLKSADGIVVCSPVSLWLTAVDRLLTKAAELVELRRVKMISGCGQQHGTVYWSQTAVEKLGNLKKNNSFASLGGSFSREECPIWMDSSTGEQCENIEEKVGGAKELAHITGSRAYHRFSGNQIAKIYKNEEEVYRNTVRISLVSSFTCSLFTGTISPIDLSDGSGMNLLDIESKDWSEICLQNTAPDLRQKLGKPVPTSTVVGSISSYLVDKYGFPPECSVVAFTGDNPASLAGLCVSDTDIALSLGTSDTVFFSTKTPQACLDGHLFVHPYVEGEYMGMACFKNGSLTRERIRKTLNLSWEQVEETLATTVPGNEGNMGIFFDLNEIAPPVKAGDYRMNSNGEEVPSFPTNVEVRALLEGQFISKLLYAKRLGWKDGKRVIVTGGASANQSILQLIADVFGMDVHTIHITDSAALAGALRARYAFYSPSSSSYQQFTSSCVATVKAASPKVPRDIYEQIMNKYVEFEKSVRTRNSYQV